jgi:tRNA1Val (adenine37-N6)-methyltransferase
MTECWEDLGVGNLKILQDKNGYCFTSDAVVLANFVCAKKTDTVVEFCAGSGIISILVCHKENPKHIYAFEIQPNVIERAKKSIEQNNMQNKITLLCDDLANAKKHVSNVQVVVCNPPYKKAQGGAVPKNQEQAISKVELATDLETIIINAKNILADGGKFYICQTPSRTAELLFKLKKHGLEPKRMFFSQPNQTSNPSCVFVECVKGANEEIKILPNLITHNDQGDYVLTVRNLFREK